MKNGVNERSDEDEDAKGLLYIREARPDCREVYAARFDNVNFFLIHGVKVSQSFCDSFQIEIDPTERTGSGVGAFHLIPSKVQDGNGCGEMNLSR